MHNFSINSPPLPPFEIDRLFSAEVFPKIIQPGLGLIKTWSISVSDHGQVLNVVPNEKHSPGTEREHSHLGVFFLEENWRFHEKEMFPTRKICLPAQTWTAVCFSQVVKEGEDWIPNSHPVAGCQGSRWRPCCWCQYFLPLNRLRSPRSVHRVGYCPTAQSVQGVSGRVKIRGFHWSV